MIRRPDRTLWVLAGLWLMLASAALFAMADYGAEQGKSGDAPTQWPDGLQGMIQPDPARPTLVLLAHPLCPCTRASLWELESITNRLFGMVNLHVLFYQPDESASMQASMQEVWRASDLKNIAARLPGTQMHADVDGRIAKHFGAYTSGHVLLYSTDGQLQFTGGITPSRGHKGTNPGRAAVYSAILGDKGIDPLAPQLNPVFGCSLHGESADDRKLVAEPLVVSEHVGDS